MPVSLRCLILGILAVALVASESTPPPDKPDKPGKQGKAAKQQEPIVQIDGVVIEAPPFRFSTDVGTTEKERRAYALRLLKPLLDTSQFFLKIYKLRQRTFEDYATFYSGNNFEKLVRVDVWQDYESFLDNYQRRYKTKSIPGAFFGVNAIVDPYGKPTGGWLREIATAAEGTGDEQVLRHLYHEMGHLFMRTYMVVSVEVPSWIEEGTAELFQYRIGNGTRPEAERLQRQGWLMEMISEGSSIPFDEFIAVRNLDNLDFTWKDPLRSTLQYAQAWSVIEFMIATPQRADTYLRMLAEFKKSAEGYVQEQGRKVTQDKLTNYLYTVQEPIFKKMFGADLVNIESLWKEWVAANYERELKKAQAIRYHRGEWCLIRASCSKDRDEALAHVARAKEIFGECKEQAPNSPEGWVGMGRIASLLGQTKEAWTEFSTALEKGSNNSEAMLYGGIARVQGGSAATAVEPLGKVVAERPNAFDANYWYGVALTASKGDVDRAIPAFSVAGSVERTRTGQCSWWEGIAHLLVGRAHPARMALTRALGQPGAPPQAVVWLAFATALDGERAEAIDLLSKAADSRDKEAMMARLSDMGGEKPLPGIGFDDRSRPFLDASSDFKPMDPPKPRTKR